MFNNASSKWELFFFFLCYCQLNPSMGKACRNEHKGFCRVDCEACKQVEGDSLVWETNKMGGRADRHLKPQTGFSKRLPIGSFEPCSESQLLMCDLMSSIWELFKPTPSALHTLPFFPPLISIQHLLSCSYFISSAKPTLFYVHIKLYFF